MLVVVLALLLHGGMHFDPHADLDMSTVVYHPAHEAPMFEGAMRGALYAC